jgi:hypothetical protein
MIATGEKCKVFIEKPDGSLLELTSVVESFSLSQKCDLVDATVFGNNNRNYISGVSHTEMEIKLYGIEPLIMTTGKDLSSRTKNALEWKCDYCGRPNRREDETCKSCGSVRSFIYG